MVKVKQKMIRNTLITFNNNLSNPAISADQDKFGTAARFAPEVINAEYEAIKNIVGNNDKVMPPVLIREFVGKDDLIIEVSGASHNEGWGKIYNKVRNER